MHATPLERSRRDRGILYAAAFLRALATGMAGIMLGIYLARLGLTPQRIGFVITAGLSGAALATLIATVGGDRLGFKRFLFCHEVFMNLCVNSIS